MFIVFVATFKYGGLFRRHNLTLSSRVNDVFQNRWYSQNEERNPSIKELNSKNKRTKKEEQKMTNFNQATPQADLEGMENSRRRATNHLEVLKTRRMNHLTTF